MIFLSGITDSVLLFIKKELLYKWFFALTNSEMALLFS